MDFYSKPNRAKICFSPCGNYRYKRWVKWSNEKPCVFVMLNPASNRKDAKGVAMRECYNIAEIIDKEEGCGGFVSVNLCAYIIGSGRQLIEEKKSGVSVVEEVAKKELNKEYLKSAMSIPNAKIIAAWGSKGKYLTEQVEEFKELARDLGKTVYYLGPKLLKGGQPPHPAYWGHSYSGLKEFSIN